MLSLRQSVWPTFFSALVIFEICQASAFSITFSAREKGRTIGSAVGASTTFRHHAPPPKQGNGGEPALAHAVQRGCGKIRGIAILYSDGSLAKD